jgi:hypothetical protein
LALALEAAPGLELALARDLDLGPELEQRLDLASALERVLGPEQGPEELEREPASARALEAAPGLGMRLWWMSYPGPAPLRRAEQPTLSTPRPVEELS